MKLQEILEIPIRKLSKFYKIKRASKNYPVTGKVTEFYLSERPLKDNRINCRGETSYSYINSGIN